MAYTIGIILFIITVIIIGLILRKRVYDNVDRLESWKLDVMNRNIAAQLSRIKSLNLSGETQEKFESWKERWEKILTKELPDVEEYLFDAEEAADRYRFPSAKKTLHKIDQSLSAIEVNIEEILDELDELLESEKTSRNEIEELQPHIKLLRRKLSQNSYQYGKSERRFEAEIDKLAAMFKSYHELTESGDYIEARRLVEDLQLALVELEKEVDEYPAIYKACKDDLPTQLKDLSSGLKSMKEEGYRVDHFGFEKDIHNYEQRLLDCIIALEKGTVMEVEAIITEMEERIKEMYELLEREAVAKSYLEVKIPLYQELLNELGTTFNETKEEVDRLRLAYYFEDSDMENYLLLEKSLTRLKKRLEDLSNDMENENISHSAIREQLETGFDQLEKLQKSHEEFKESIYNLRKDELEAKEKLTEVREEVNQTKRKLEKSNIPGVPSFIWSLMDAAYERINQVIHALDKKPLDISEVQNTLIEAKLAVDNAVDQTDMIIEQAYLTEQVIQYANRYRSGYPLLAAKLVESERLFRSYEYELSLEHAAAAVEEIEPGALKRIEAYPYEEV